ncbi:TPA_exp: Uncharacterized protein A8136_0705 [Trichophyton benhamiae CBS 112371]|uniref:Cell pattern formation-associated protein STUA n=2 Tax=Trichophyton TaxID=5550 RepID=D4AU73_ARTBC|nr:uncharacterized protein ARB_07703 [Trichophyton benhamiae CBS 112371]EFE33343.1 hypothetical protein ARB_07703 [Trichophyton benhamiae CBS 112371]DAA76391.1 TPA_exp: Uncharacterized protein A8136_0705 [Trichophyton benhamiae CBS 112371]
MNQTQPYMDVQSSHLASSQPYTSQGTPTENSISHYPQYQQPSLLQPGPTAYAPSHSYPPQYGYSNGITSPPSNQPVPNPLNGQGPTQILPLPPLNSTAPNSHGYVPNSASQVQHYSSQTPYDTTGQIAPPGVKPRVTATLWEDEGSLCFQVEAKGVCVARREDNHMINGTKLLNVAGMTRGRRDGILKSEKIRHVVKIGPMHLKGVWIPFERALDFANKEKITDQLYPLFVHAIGSLLYHPVNENRANAIVTASDRRRIESSQPLGRPGPGGHPPPLHHHHSMQNPTTTHMSQPSSLATMPHPMPGRPPLDRAHTFPTPPTSASSLVGMPNQPGSYEWNGQNMSNGVQSSQPLPLESGMNGTRSMPTTPATTPPGANMSAMQAYQGQSAYSDSKAYYSSAPAPQSHYASQQPVSQQSISSQGNGQVNGSNGANTTEPESTEQHQGTDGEYINDSNGNYNSNRASYPAYPSTQAVGSMPNEHTPLPSEMAAPPPHQNGADKRSSGPWPSTYTPRSGAPSSVYSVMSDTRNSPANNSGTATYPDAYSASTSTPSYSSSMNGSSKRSRDEDDVEEIPRSDSRGEGSVYEHKRRKTLIDSASGPIVPASISLQSVQSGNFPRRI